MLACVYVYVCVYVCLSSMPLGISASLCVCLYVCVYVCLSSMPLGISASLRHLLINMLKRNAADRIEFGTFRCFH